MGSAEQNRTGNTSDRTVKQRFLDFVMKLLKFIISSANDFLRTQSVHTGVNVNLLLNTLISLYFFYSFLTFVFVFLQKN